MKKPPAKKAKPRKPLDPEMARRKINALLQFLDNGDITMPQFWEMKHYDAVMREAVIAAKRTRPLRRVRQIAAKFGVSKSGTGVLVGVLVGCQPPMDENTGLRPPEQGLQLRLCPAAWRNRLYPGRHRELGRGFIKDFVALGPVGAIDRSNQAAAVC